MDFVVPTKSTNKPDTLRHHHPRRRRLLRHLLPLFSLALLLILLFFFFFSFSPSSYLPRSPTPPSYGGPAWEKRVRSSALPSPRRRLSVLVTGAAGFLGSHASSALKRRGDGVLGLDSFSPPDLPLKRARQSLLSRSGVFVVHGDASDATLLRKLFDVAPFTHLLHLASSPSSLPASVSADVSALVALLEAARSADPQPSFLWASSTAVYGLNTPSNPSIESDRTDRPAALHAATKKAGEEITHAYNHIYGLSITALRLSAVYGPWGLPGDPYFAFTRAILKHKPVPVSEGSIDLVYVDDVVKAILAALDTAAKSTGRGGKKRGPAPMRVYNVGSGSVVPVVEVLEVLERLLNVRAERKAGGDDARSAGADIRLAERELGYRPATDLKRGLKRFVRWYFDYYSANSPLRKMGGGQSSWE